MTDLRFRPPALVLGLVDYVAEGDGTPIPWAEVVDVFTTDEVPARTVEATLYDLMRFGVLYRAGVGGQRRQRDTRTLRVTPLGAAWRDSASFNAPDT